jgi:hypothetical protein
MLILFFFGGRSIIILLVIKLVFTHYTTSDLQYEDVLDAFLAYMDSIEDLNAALITLANLDD